MIQIIFVSKVFFAQQSNIELNSIDFVGNEFFDAAELEKIITLKESPSSFSQFLNSFTSFGSSATYFDSLSVQDDINLLLKLYKSFGFFKTKISAKYELDENGSKEANLVFYITEREPCLIRDYNLKGFENLPKDLYTKMIGMVNIDSSTQYSELLVEEHNAIIVNYLQDQGYMLTESRIPVVEVDTVYNFVDITVNYLLGKRYRVSEVRVEKSGPGEPLVSKDLIEEIANITPEKYYSHNQLRLAQIRLYRTNLFSSAVISGNINDTSGYHVPVDIITKVGKLNELSPEIILINEENILKLGLGLTYSNKNFFGSARKLTIGTSAAAQNITEFIKEANLTSNNIYGYADARVSLEQPFLFGKPINTLFEMFYTLEKKKNQWNASIYGAKLNLNFELPPYIYLTALSTYFTWQNSEYIYQESYVKSELEDKLSDSLLDSLITGSLTTKNTSAILGVNLVSNNTDDFLYPTRGYSVSILAEDGNSIPYLISKIGNYNLNQTAYYKLVLTGTIYFPFMQNVFDSFGTKIKLGTIEAYHGDLFDIPYNQRLTAGGSNSIRGWGANDLPVTDYVIPKILTQTDIENIARNITPGAFFLLEGSLEARQHLSEKIGVALFIDYGNVWNKYEDFRFNEVAVASGFGLRYYSDFAPIRLDFGFKAYNPYDRRSFFTRLKHSPFLDNLEFQVGIGEAF